jgi:outer membrane lipoprotein-sorting protein
VNFHVGRFALGVLAMLADGEAEAGLPIVTALQKVYTKIRNITAKRRTQRSNYRQTRVHQARFIHQFGAMSHLNRRTSTGHDTQ